LRKEHRCHASRNAPSSDRPKKNSSSAFRVRNPSTEKTATPYHFALVQPAAFAVIRPPYRSRPPRAPAPESAELKIMAMSTLLPIDTRLTARTAGRSSARPRTRAVRRGVGRRGPAVRGWRDRAGRHLLWVGCIQQLAGLTAHQPDPYRQPISAQAGL